MITVLLLAVMTTSFGSNPVVGRALVEAFGPAQLTVFRWVAGALLFGALALWRGRRERWPATISEWGLILGLGVIGLGVCSYVSYRGVQETTATNFSLIFACTTAVIVAAEWALGWTRASALVGAGLVLCIGGAVTIITRGEPARIAALHFNVGELWALVAVAAWSLYTLMLKRSRITASPCVMFVITCIAGALTDLPIAVVETARQGWPVLRPGHAVWLSALVLFGGAAGFIAYNVAVERAGAVMTSAAMTLNPLTTALLAMALLGERPAWFHAMGATLVIGGLMLINFDRARTPARSQPAR